MAIIELLLPKMGESVMEATIIKWLKSEGDSILVDESILEVATDKVDTEVPSIKGGILKKILVKEGDMVSVGAIIAEIETTDSEPIKVQTEKIVETIENNIAEIKDQYIFNNNPKIVADNKASNKFYSPLVLSIARNENISFEELENIEGTGKENRVTKYDILNYLEKGRKHNHLTKNPVTESNIEIPKNISIPQVVISDNEIKPKIEAAKEETKSKTESEIISKPSISYTGNADIIEMDRMRKMIAHRMIESQKISAHVTTFLECDVTNLFLWRSKVRHEFMRKENEPITFTPVFVEAIAKILKEMPLMNASVEGDRIIVKKDINIGIAVALDNGNLIVPVIKNADQLNITGITKRVNELVRKAKDNKLTLDDVSGGTYTISNVGTFGNLMGTPILVQPQVGIMAFGSIKKKPAVIETDTGDTIGIRHLMFLSHSYDHRVIDGALGGKFVKKVADYLEKFDISRGV